MLAPLGISLIYHDGSTIPILNSFLITCAIGIIMYCLSKTKNSVSLSQREGMAIVTFGWISAALFGSLPFLLSGSIDNMTDAYFESISGFTTTGATILPNIESLPEGILFWRSMIQWFGGMGIIVLSIAILPFFGIGGMQLYRAEIPSPVVDKLQPRISETAKSLWKIYFSITLLEVSLLWVGGMSLFDSINHAFCTMPTGGFSTQNASIAQYNSTYFDTIVIIFMILAGINFSLHFRFLKGELKVFGDDPECRVFLLTLVILISIVAFNIYQTVYNTIGQAIRYASFQVVSIITTTGFVTADYTKWPPLSQIIIVLCMFVGAMAGSTGGAIKVMRIILIIKHGYQEIFRLVHPHAVRSIKLGGKPIPLDILNSVRGFFILYLSVFIVAVIIMSSLGLDIFSSFASVAATLGNVGPGFGLVGPVQNYLSVDDLGKWVLSFCMLTGRLEIYTVIILLAPAYWRK
ncbi:MAG: TrkH family potassium uptake protein [Deltaproteobacteria bacterium]|nr:TrkH family potassium uptake protein [Deltaproteobacteria bacterium]